MPQVLPPSRTADQFIVRFPDGMRDRIADAAKQAGRSMNAEIIQRLEATFNAPPEGQAGGLTGLQSVRDLDAQLGTMAKLIGKLNTQLRSMDAGTSVGGGLKAAGKKPKRI